MVESLQEAALKDEKFIDLTVEVYREDIDETQTVQVPCAFQPSEKGFTLWLAESEQTTEINFDDFTVLAL